MLVSSLLLVLMSCLHVCDFLLSSNLVVFNSMALQYEVPFLATMQRAVIFVLKKLLMNKISDCSVFL